MMKTMPTDCNSHVNHCGIDDLPAVEYARTTKTVVMTQCIFENAFSDEWTVAEPDSPTRTTIIDHVIRICDFPSDSVMVKFIDQQQWSMLEHIVSAGFDDVGELFMVRDDGITFEDTPMLTHLRRFKAILLYYHSKICWGETPTEDDVMNWTPKDFKKYCSSKAYHDDYAKAFPTTLKPSQRAGIYGNIRGTRNGSGISGMTCPVTLHEVHQGVKKDKMFYENKKDRKDISEWNSAVTQDHTHSNFHEYDHPELEKEQFVRNYSFYVMSLKIA